MSIGLQSLFGGDAAVAMYKGGGRGEENTMRSDRGKDLSFGQHSADNTEP